MESIHSPCILSVHNHILGVINMDGITPSPNVTKLGSLLVIFLIALLAVWMVNNVVAIGKLTAKRAVA